MGIKISKSQIWRIVFVFVVMSGYGSYRTFDSSPSVDFEKVNLKKEGAGNSINLTSLQGKVTLVAFFQTWCSDCIKEMPTILTLQNQVKSSNLKVIMVTDEPIAKLEKFKQRFPGYTFEYYLTDEKLTSFGIKKYPTTYLVNEKGRILKSALEGYDWGSKEIIDIVTNELNN